MKKGGFMLEKLHEHIVSELNQSSRTDTIFVITAIIFNLIVLAVNSGIASEGADRYSRSASDDVVLTVFIVISILINTIAVSALNLGKNRRNNLLSGLVSMYTDNNIEKYYHPSLLKNYSKRYILFIAVILCLTLLSNAVPLIIRFV